MAWRGLTWENVEMAREPNEFIAPHLGGVVAEETGTRGKTKDGGVFHNGRKTEKTTYVNVNVNVTVNINFNVNVNVNGPTAANSGRRPRP